MAAAIEASVVGTFSLFSRGPSTGSRLTPDLSFYTTEDVPFPLFNHVYQTRLPAEDADARIETVRRHYAARGLPFMWSVGPFTCPSDLCSRLESHDLVRVDEQPGMAADLRSLNEDVPYPAGLTVERVRDAEGLKEYADAMVAGFGMPGFTARALREALDVPGPVQEASFVHYAGRIDGEVLATASFSLAAGVAGVYNVATLPGARKRGLGAALTLAALRGARERGYRIGVLQSSAVGQGIYRRLGFERYSTYSLYVGTDQNRDPDRYEAR